MITIREETTSALREYAKVSIAFRVESRYVAVSIGGTSEGWELIEEPIDPPWIKDYDAGEPPTLRSNWDTSNWRIFSAFDGACRVGGAMVACRTPESDFLEGREDLAALWDIRVQPEWRGRGIGSMLFEHVVGYAKRVGCVELKIETQDINVKACDFYAKQGCRLVKVIPDAYPGWPDEVEFNWMLKFD